MAMSPVALVLLAMCCISSAGQLLSAVAHQNFEQGQKAFYDLKKGFKMFSRTSV